MWYNLMFSVGLWKPFKNCSNPLSISLIGGAVNDTSPLSKNRYCLGKDQLELEPIWNWNSSAGPLRRLHGVADDDHKSGKDIGLNWGHKVNIWKGFRWHYPWKVFVFLRGDMKWLNYSGQTLYTELHIEYLKRINN